MRHHRRGSIPIGERFATADDGTPLHWYPFPPSGIGKNTAIIQLHVGGFDAGNPGPAFVCQDLAEAGYCVFACEYRLAPPGELLGQRSLGHYPDQTNDVKLAVSAARKDSRCNGKVAVVGGSAGGTHAIHVGSTGTVGQDRADAVVALSPATNLADSVQSDKFHRLCVNYVGSSDLAKLKAASPISFFSATSAPTLVTASQFEGIDGNPGVPPEQFADMLAFDGNTNFESFMLLNRIEHAFRYWPDVKERVLTFLSARL